MKEHTTNFSKFRAFSSGMQVLLLATVKCASGVGFVPLDICVDAVDL